MVLLISYDLNKHERPEAYAEVKAVIDKYAIDKKKALYSQWLVETSDSPETWSDRIKAVADEDDSWLVLKMGSSYSGWLPGSIWPWLKDRI